MSLWKPIAITETIQELRTGSLVLRFFRDENTLFLNWEHQSEEITSFDIQSTSYSKDEFDWKQWIVGDLEELVIRPRLPDIPVVVKPSSELKLISGAKTSIFVEIPLTIICGTSSDRKDAIVEIPSEKLSKTWFGEPTGGELCYFVKTGINQTTDKLSSAQNRAIATISIVNDAQETLQFKRFSLAAKELAIYGDNSRFWTEQVEVRFRGAANESRIRSLGKPTGSATDLKLFYKGHKNQITGLVRKSFDTFFFPKG